MHIDAHQHFWRYERREYGWIDDSMAALRRDFLPADLKPELERSGFQGCVAVQARQTLEETRWLLELAEHAPFILGVVGWVDLRSPRLRFELESFARHSKLVGVRHIVQSEPDDRFLLQPDFLRGIATLEEFDLAYDILIYPRHLRVARSSCRDFRGSALFWIIWRNRRSRAELLIPGRSESGNWRLFRIFFARCLAWSRKQTGRPGSPRTYGPVWTWRSNASDRAG